MSKKKPVHPFKVGDEVRCFYGGGNGVGTVVQTYADEAKRDVLKVNWPKINYCDNFHHTHLYPADDPHGHLRRFLCGDSRTEALLADFDAAKARIAELEATLIKESARTADAVQRADHFEKRLDTANSLGKAVREELAQAVTHIAELKKDAARLDYLQQQTATVDLLVRGDGFEFRIADRTHEANADIRVAIDAAMTGRK